MGILGTALGNPSLEHDLDRVFAAWTEPELMRRWTPDGIRIGEAELDLRVGGRYRTEMIADDGSRHVVVGRYLEIEPPARLRFTHGWLHEGQEPEDVDARATEVTMELHDEGIRPATPALRRLRTHRARSPRRVTPPASRPDPPPPPEP